MQGPFIPKITQRSKGVDAIRDCGAAAGRLADDVVNIGLHQGGLRLGRDREDGSVGLAAAPITGWYQAGYAEAVAGEAVAISSSTPESSSSQDCRLDGAPGC